jgi:hypothetical protein
MLGYGIMAICASYFYRLGEKEYQNKGILLAFLSVILALGADYLFDLGDLGILGANIALYLLLFAYNMFSDPPQG